MTATTPLITVYDLEGKAHEMTSANARDMCTHSGWSQSIMRAPAKPQTKEELLAEFEKRGVQYDKRWGIEKLQEVLAADERAKVLGDPSTEAEVGGSIDDGKASNDPTPAGLRRMIGEAESLVADDAAAGEAIDATDTKAGEAVEANAEADKGGADAEAAELAKLEADLKVLDDKEAGKK